MSRAVALLETARKTAEGLGEPLVQAWSLLYLTLIACDLGDTARAAELLRGHPIETNPAFHHNLPEMLAVAAVFAQAVGHPESAARLFGAADGARNGIPTTFPERVSYERSEESARRHLGNLAYMEAWNRGRRSRTADSLAVVESLLDGDAPRTSTPPLGGANRSPLTDRETDVLRLLAESLHNQQIAEKLFVSRRTVDNHIANILGKLNVGSRTAAVAYAIRHDLV
ncbi:MAG: response regulator transcription factor [Chloroflexota bacterium]|nr:response regulator transcription factor [Chloroflexota bacterium]